MQCNLYEYGEEAENVVFNYFKQFGINCVRTVVDKNDSNSKYENIIHGDISLQSDRFIFYFDVKRGTFISKKSIDSFKGQFYILFPEGDISDVKNSRVIKRTTIINYFNQVADNKIKKGPSGSKGYRFSNIKNFVTLEDFTINYIKRVLIMGENNQQYIVSSWGEYCRDAFTKVLPKSSIETLS